MDTPVGPWNPINAFIFLLQNHYSWTHAHIIHLPEEFNVEA